LTVSKNSGQQEQLKIDLLPDYAVISVKSTVLLKSITICDNFIKDVSPELEWFSSDPSVASVDQNGRVYSKSTGETEITCRYRRYGKQECRIAVVEALPGVEVAAIDREMSR